jgi:wobble nucleotide-excising tRNase
MLKKILKIKNVGLFRDASWASSTSTFEQTTLIHAENGRGKSTLASILRSCGKGDAESMNTRQSLGSTGALEVEFLFQSGDGSKKIIFSENKWNNSYDNILVFDADFINKNVYSGVEVSTSHRQELLEFALGEDAVLLKQKVNNETQHALEKGKDITRLEKNLKIYTKGVGFKKFTELQFDPEIDNGIEFYQKRLNEARNNNSLQERKSPVVLGLPYFDLENFFMILGMTFNDLETSTEAAMQLHISHHPKTEFENWLSQGELFEDNSSCPYCGQDIKGSDLLKLYKNYFNQSYKNLQSKALSLDQSIKTGFSNDIVNKIISVVEINQIIAGQWINEISSQGFDLDKDRLIEIFGLIHDFLCKLATSKQKNVLEIIGSQTDRNQADLLWNELVFTIGNYNKLINASISEITNFKKDLSLESINQIEQEIENLNLKKIRYEEQVCNLILEWNEAKEAKQQHEQNKLEFRSQLDSLMTDTLQQYQVRINSLVEKFGGLFEINGLGYDYKGSGDPRSNYALKVKGKDVKLSADGAPSFSTALSEGDKRTLAFAFFIARIENDPNIKNKIVVFDDPVCSLDRN